MNTRQLSRQIYPPPPRELDYDALDSFQTDTITELKQIRLDYQQDFRRLAERMSELEAVLTWVGTHRPEALLDYKTTHAVINRLEDDHEIMEKEA